MKMMIKVLSLAGICVVSLQGCGAGSVSYSKDVRPILDKNCVECHKEGGKGYDASGLDMESYEGLMKGTKFGAVIKPGDSFTSALVMLIEGRGDPSIKMPHGTEDYLSAEDIATLKEWVDQGAKNN